jgi:methylated-DNA-[protein]-cysteine S-methyltransferase
MSWTTYQSPLGTLTLIGGDAGLRAVRFPGRVRGLGERDRDPAALTAVAEQLGEYFAGERETFDLELDIAGTALQRQVWSALRSLPYGRTTTYGELAGELGVEASGAFTGARKVAAAIAATPAPIVVPCHRVIGANGALTGYRGGLQRKRALLDFEATGRAIDARCETGESRQLALL